MSTVTTQPPTKEQLDRIRQMSGVVLGDPGRLFQHVGEPETRWEASAMLGALHKVRNQQPGSSFEEKTLISQINELTAAPEKETPMPKAEGNTKKCSGCGEEKFLDQFGTVSANPDGLNYCCKVCLREKSQAAYAKKKGKAVKPGKATEPPPLDEPKAESGSLNGWAEGFHNPTLLQLRLLAQFLGGATLDETAEVCEKIARGVPA